MFGWSFQTESVCLKRPVMGKDTAKPSPASSSKFLHGTTGMLKASCACVDDIISAGEALNTRSRTLVFCTITLPSRKHQTSKKTPKEDAKNIKTCPQMYTSPCCQTCFPLRYELASTGVASYGPSQALSSPGQTSQSSEGKCTVLVGNLGSRRQRKRGNSKSCLGGLGL